VLETAVPALLPIGAAVVIGLPAARQVRPKERRVAALAMIIAVSVAAAAIGSQLFMGPASSPKAQPR
jgi:cytochrome bd-type quinol oxidase subunit 1